jgi:hypothetical protein
MKISLENLLASCVSLAAARACRPSLLLMTMSVLGIGNIMAAA